MRIVLFISIALGVLWNFLAVGLMGGRLADALAPSWLLAGAGAGLAAGKFTLFSRERRDGEESFRDVLLTYYLGIVVYWLGIVIWERLRLCVQHGGWTDFNLHDHLSMILLFLSLGTFWYGILLIPLTFGCRVLLWKLHHRFS